jgi:hypothetical protein
MELERFTGLSVFSRHAFVSGLMVARAKNPVHSILKMIRWSNDIIVDVRGILFSIDLRERIEIRLQHSCPTFYQVLS